jgi:small nuclear ribonucleoprotein (snRNP)-like protein
MNLLLQEATDVSEDRNTDSKPEAQMGEILIRGDNVIIISVE